MLSLASSRGRPRSGHGSTTYSVAAGHGHRGSRGSRIRRHGRRRPVGDGGARPRLYRARRRRGERRSRTSWDEVCKAVIDHQRHDQLHPGPVRDRWQPAGQQHRRRICQRWIAERDDLHRRRLQGPAGHHPVGLEGRPAVCRTRTTCCTPSPPATRIPKRDLSGAGRDQLRGALLRLRPLRQQRRRPAGVLVLPEQDRARHNRPTGKFTGVHKTGDLLIISDFSNGGTTSTISVYKWTAPHGNLRLLALPDRRRTAAKCGGGTPTTPSAASSTRPTAPRRPGRSPTRAATARTCKGEFYEAGVNLSRLLGLGGECFSSFVAETRSSTSTTATLKDFVLGQFANCSATLTTTPTARTRRALSSRTAVTDLATVQGAGTSAPADSDR